MDQMKYLEQPALNIISPTPIVDMIDDSFIKVTNSFPSWQYIFKSLRQYDMNHCFE